ncbi:hypothetical protein H257_00899 [Aphanomyces astaci]|uniref:Receptor expression-enhancing protein n=1 Tax=Aphanomyces astaci TaxID=112090 RepID=W4HEZ1_APHAT|nr:hypothetical protein H257_00899 [Aphanomyces astaci]ETV89733.1 hypothetical protein H257_00899 [Aphanomyces astaci]KAF0726030.1 hypothetical protein AaE_009647 [Aphanomyces astaci]RHX98188.1 hypothetical protein DYB25_000470 [Aphanomyces astaci]RHY01435.1 hypothetical protein DYB36_003512 [Aphanomyces astaci]RHY46315.1 hypothetical protein DYB34_000133 [Aphanomyces astaci]|eukprot:XP_009822133.1 hypothetical protein H257_00899 [Aphanomyces astaci]
MEQFNIYRAKITARLERYEQLKELEKQTGVDKFFIVAILAAIAGVLLFVVGGAHLISNLVGFIYPAYMSFKALNTDTAGDDTQWLTYWVVYSAFNLTEQITDTLLFWVPMYFFIKIAFLVWCYHPSTLGATTIYESLIKPNLAGHVNQIDGVLKQASDAAKKASNLAKEATKTAAGKLN